ncbi:MAG: PilZ domain-containing protein [Bdellovibrionales bacterium]|nr:PilZ domain-containing protein [Bdellovibrionales bacterium]
MTAVQKDLHRRRVPRRTFDNPVGVLVRGTYTIERAFQVGEGGMMICYKPHPLAIGDHLVASFFLSPLSTVIVRGIVRNVIPAEGNLPIRYGIEFANLEFQYKREIRNFVASATQTEAV